MTIDKKENTLLINIESTSKEEDEEDKQELEQITHNLRDELNELDTIENVDLIRREDDDAESTKKGYKTKGDIVALGSLLVTLGGISAAAGGGSTIIPNLVNTLQSWLTRHERHKITMEIGGDKLEVKGVSDKEQQRLIDA
jgi:hypothetical protein